MSNSMNGDTDNRNNSGRRTREERLAEQLRANLKKRKALKKARAEKSEEGGAGDIVRENGSSEV